MDDNLHLRVNGGEVSSEGALDTLVEAVEAARAYWSESVVREYVDAQLAGWKEERVV